MKAARLRAVELVRRIRNRHARQLAGKTEAEVIAFYRAAGEAAMDNVAMDNVQRKAKPRNRRAG